MTIDILMYHGFTDVQNHQGIANYGGKHLYINKFEDQLRYLVKNYSVVSQDELWSFYTQGAKLPKRPVVITIDDGYKSNFKLAFPVLQKYKVPATVFVSVDFIDQQSFLWVDRVEFLIDQTRRNTLMLEFGSYRFDPGKPHEKVACAVAIKRILKKMSHEMREGVLLEMEKQLDVYTKRDVMPELYAPMNWSDVQSMHTSGLVSIGSHTITHTIATSVSIGEFTDEVRNSKNRIENKLQSACHHFSYPNGQLGDFNDSTHHVLSKSGYRSAVVTVAGSNNELSNRYQLKRLNIDNQGNMGGFKRTLSPVFRYLRNLKNACQAH